MIRNIAVVRWSPILAVVLSAGLFTAAPVLAQGPGTTPEEMQRYMQERGYGGYGMGPGMMDGSMMGGGYGYGPGMMGGGMGGMGMMGMGPGMMMGGGGMGMMGGAGMGMMGGAGMGMMGGGMGPVWMLNLSDEQRSKINKIHDDTRKKTWELYGKINDESAKLRDLYDTDAPDAKKIGAIYDKVFDIQRQIIVGGIEAQNKMRGVLNKEQLEQLKNFRRGMPNGAGGSYGPNNMPRGGMGPGMMGR